MIIIPARILAPGIGVTANAPTNASVPTSAPVSTATSAAASATASAPASATASAPTSATASAPASATASAPISPNSTPRYSGAAIAACLAAVIADRLAAAFNACGTRTEVAPPIPPPTDSDTIPAVSLSTPLDNKISLRRRLLTICVPTAAPPPNTAPLKFIKLLAPPRAQPDISVAAPAAPPAVTPLTYGSSIPISCKTLSVANPAAAPTPAPLTVRPPSTRVFIKPVLALNF